jgi:protein-tyrosine phosphatase
MRAVSSDPLMTTILDLINSTDPRDDVHRGVQALAEGKLIGLPLDSGYGVAALATITAAVEELGNLDLRTLPACLVLSSNEAACDYMPPLSPTQERMMTRLWPGPVVLRIPDSSTSGLSRRLSEAVLRLAAESDELRLMVTDSPVAVDVLRLLKGPLVVRLEATTIEAARRRPQMPERVELVLDAGPAAYPGEPTVVRLTDDGAVVLSEGVVTTRDVRGAGCETTLFVCTGNTCRSPMAAALFRKLLAARLQCSEEDLEQRGYRVLSAGLSAAKGMPASPEAVELLEQRGGGLSGHSSRPLTPALLSQADHVFTMTVNHRMTILQQQPELARRIHTLAPDGTDVVDPIGCGPDEYRRCAEQISGYLQRIVDNFLIR